MLYYYSTLYLPLLFQCTLYVPLFLGEVVTLVDEYDILFGVVDFLHVFLEVLAAEQERVSAVHNLYDDIAAINHTIVSVVLIAV